MKAKEKDRRDQVNKLHNRNTTKLNMTLSTDQNWDTPLLSGSIAEKATFGHERRAPLQTSGSETLADRSLPRSLLLDWPSESSAYITIRVRATWFTHFGYWVSWDPMFDWWRWGCPLWFALKDLLLLLT